MSEKTPKPSTEKENLHPRNLHRNGYNFAALIASSPGLKPFVRENEFKNDSIDFSDPEGVKKLNEALLKHFYGINFWEIPAGYLCPPIPGRADYIHYAADLLAENNGGVIPRDRNVKVLDIGVGANCVYPIIGGSVYGWQFVGTDVDTEAIRSAKKIVSANEHLKNLVTCRLQANKADVLNGVMKPGELFDLTICNPPFHTSRLEAGAGTAKKWQNLKNEKDKYRVLNFGGKMTELMYPGGEFTFINRMIEQSIPIGRNCLWFSTLVSKKESLAGIYKTLDWAKAVDVKTISMAQGQKVSRIIAWTFLNEDERNEWWSKKI